MKIIFRKLSVILLSGTAKDTLLMFSTYILTSLLAFAYTIFLTRTFNPQDLGIFSAISAFILLVADVLDLGITASLSRFYPEINHNEGEKKALFFIGNTFKFQFFLAVFTVIFIIAFGPLLSELMFKSDSYSNLYLFAAVGVLATVMLSYTSATLSAQRKFTKVSLILIVSTMIKLSLIIFLFSAQKFSLVNVTASFALAPLIAFLFALKFVNLSIFKHKFNFGLLQKLLSYSTFIALARVLSAISSRFDALMLIPLASAYEAGIYSAAFKIIFFYNLLSGSFSSVIAPRLAIFKNVRESVPYLKKICLIVLLMILSILILFFAAPVIVPFVLGPSYIDAIGVFQGLLLPAGLFVSTIPPVNFLLYVAKKPQVAAFNTAVQFVLILLGNYYFIPKYGRFGPVITLTLAYSFTFLTSTAFTFYYLRHD